MRARGDAPEMRFANGPRRRLAKLLAGSRA
jgi:hypothetical protein